MRCLRCGREMKDGSNVCECKHFYDNNLNIYNKIKKKRKKHITLAELLAIIVILSIFLTILIPFLVEIYNENNHKNEYNNEDDGQVKETHEYCDLVCEGLDYIISDNYCYCNNGTSYVIEE